MIPGLVETQTVNLPLRGRPQFGLSFTAAGVAVNLTAQNISVDFYRRLEDAVALFTRDNGANGGVTVDGLATNGDVIVEITELQKASFDPRAVYAIVATVTDAVTGQITSALTAYVVPTLLVPGAGFAITAGAGSTVLSIKYKNTANSLLGEAYLDTIACVAQPVGCFLEIYIDENNQPQTWDLRASAVASVAGATRRCSDYAAGTNEKVWFRSA